MGSAAPSSCLNLQMTVAIYFNDLTLVHDDERNKALLPDLAKVWAGLSDASGIVQMRLDDDAYVVAMRCVNAMPRSAAASLLRKAMRRPYEYEGMPEGGRDEFWGCEYHCHLETDERKECRALGWSIASSSLSVGLCSGAFWERLLIPVCVTDVNGKVRMAEALCVTTQSHLSDNRVSSWCAGVKTPVPLPTQIPVEQKKIVIHGDHHGNDIMRTFAERLADSKYVLDVMSVEYQKSNASPFINQIFGDGRIRVCMYWEDIHYQLLVKTTAMNFKQGEYVANLLEQQFDCGYRKR